MPRFACVVGCLLVANLTFAQDALRQTLALEETIQKAAAKAEPSIACILVSRSELYHKCDRRVSRLPGQLGDFRPHDARSSGLAPEAALRLNMAALDYVPDSYGSGVALDSSGLVLTNYHVVREAVKIFVRLPGRVGSYADIHAADERSDLAVLRLLDPPSTMPTLPMGDGSGLKKGQFIIAMANPFAAGFRDGSPSLTWGMVSNLRRRIPGETNEIDRRRPRLHYYGVLVQTDLRLNLGCSGGALLDLKGNWIGLTTAQAAVGGGDTPGGFVLPLDARMKKIIDVLRRGEEVEYGFLGISLGERDQGVTVNRVTMNGPAERAGLTGGERIVKIEDEPIRDSDDLFLNVSVGLAGQYVRVETEQQGRRRTLKVKLVKAHWPPSGPVIAINRPRPVHGLTVDYTSTMLRGLLVEGSGIPPGVVVREVTPGSPAAKAGLKPETDVIVAVNGVSVNSPEEFRAAVKNAPTLELILADSSRKVKLP